MLRTNTVKPELLARLRQLMDIKELNEFYLVGGTGLSLYYGHRLSVDIDLFTYKSFNAEEVEQVLYSKLDKVSINGLSKIFLFSFIDGVKVDFVNNATILSYPVKIFEGIRIADERDIAALKMKAIFQMGNKKDFVDLYILLQHFSLDELLDFFSTLFPKIDIGQLLLSLYYFNDAEETEMPILLVNTNWEKIKKYISTTVIDYLKN